MTKKRKPGPNIGVGMPHWYYLHLFGRVVNDAFGDFPFLVGSSTLGKSWRDVDVRLMLCDDKYEALIGKWKQPEGANRKWQAFNMAFSELGLRMTGLPIDFQIQQATWANKVYGGKIRCSLILACIDDE